GGGDELRLTDRDHLEGRCRGAGALDVGVPREGGGELPALGGVHRVVGLLAIAQAHHVDVAGGQAGLEVHHGGGEILGLAGDQAGAAGQPGEAGEVRQVRGGRGADLRSEERRVGKECRGREIRGTYEEQE